MLLQIGLQILIEARLSGEFHGMVAAFSLWEIAVYYRKRAVLGGEVRHDDPALCIVFIRWETATDFKGFLFTQQRDAVVTLLSVIINVVTVLADIL